MNYFEFENLCFNIPDSKQYISLLIASKSEHCTFQEFIKAAIKKDFEEYITIETISLSELYEQIINVPASDKDKQYMFKMIEAMNEKIEIEFEEIENMVVVFKNEENDYTFAFETKYCRYYFHWITLNKGLIL